MGRPRSPQSGIAIDRLIIYGAGGHGRVILEAALAGSGFDVVGFIDDDPDCHGATHHGVPVLGSADILQRPEYADCLLIVGLGDGAARRTIVNGLGDRSFAIVQHPSAVVGLGAMLGEGAVVLPMAVIHTDAKIGPHAIVNTSATVDHDSEVGAFAHLSPGAHLGGNVQIGEGTHIGLGASVIPGVRIGKDVVVGAGAVVVDDVSDGLRVAGVPARAIQGS